MIGRVVIFGDSYSTHKDVIPTSYPAYYYTGGRSPEEAVTDMRPEETWWGRLISETGATLVHNNSWSGSTIGYTGYLGDCSHSSSFIYRFRCLCESGFFDKNELDTVFIFGGTNDSWSDAPLGEAMLSGWQESDLYSVLPAISYFISAVKEKFPDKRLVVISNCDIKSEIRECMASAAAAVGAILVPLHDIEKQSRHPNKNGMKEIASQVMATLLKYE